MSAVIQLLTAHNDSKLVTASILVFGAASVMFLFPLIVSVLAFSAAAELNTVPAEPDNLNTFAVLVMFGAIYVFISGIGLAGRIHHHDVCNHFHVPCDVCNLFGAYPIPHYIK